MARNYSAIHVFSFFFFFIFLSFQSRVCFPYCFASTVFYFIALSDIRLIFDNSLAFVIGINCLFVRSRILPPLKILSNKVKQIVGWRPLGLHIPARLMKDRWADSEQGAVGLITPVGPIICHPPWDLSVQPATAVLPQLWIIGHVRKHHTTLSYPVLEPNALGTSSSLSHSWFVWVCAHIYTHMHAPLDCTKSSLIVTPSWNMWDICGISLIKHTSAPAGLSDYAI